MNQKNPKENINGIVLVNKPQGLSSNAVLQEVKRLYNASKAGHTGSLDPLATGMLPICLGEATKFSQYVLNSSKTYQTTGLLGIKTNTADSLGEVISQVEHFNVSQEQLLSVVQTFVGHTMQTPSMFSALKHNGTPLYKLAIKGISIERSQRPIFIDNMQLTAFDGSRFQLTVSCSKGTYIRNLVEDIGEMLGVGAHVIQLHRLHTAGYTNYPMHTMDELRQATPEQRLKLLLPIDTAVKEFPAVCIDEQELTELRMGRVITRQIPAGEEGLVRLYDQQDRFAGLGQFENITLIVKRLLSESNFNTWA